MGGDTAGTMVHALHQGTRYYASRCSIGKQHGRGCLEMDWLFLKADVAREQPTTHLFFQYLNLRIQGHHVILM
jgi:hypothetical protein